MSVITSIKPQKSKKRVNIYLDGRFGFGLDLENFVKLNLKIDQELSKEEVKEIIQKSDFSKVLEKLLSFAMLRPRSEKEINDWLRRKKIEKSLYKELFNRLKKYELIDDQKFAKWWIDQRLTFKKKSIKEIKFELLTKGISNEIVNNTFDEFEIDEEKIAKDLVKSKAYKWKKFDKNIRKQKMKEFLLRKGFSWNIVSKVVQ